MQVLFWRWMYISYGSLQRQVLRLHAHRASCCLYMWVPHTHIIYCPVRAVDSLAAIICHCSEFLWNQTPLLFSKHWISFTQTPANSSCMSTDLPLCGLQRSSSHECFRAVNMDVKTPAVARPGVTRIRLFMVTVSLWFYRIGLVAQQVCVLISFYSQHRNINWLFRLIQQLIQLAWCPLPFLYPDQIPLSPGSP